jgi:uncharacterized protein YdeI (YjbR/CyaY-like superfamily)
MTAHDARVDAYIANAADFAQPILTRVREIVHKHCPAVEETLKWGMPTFMHHGILCGMAAFKHHCSFGFWKHALVVDKKVVGNSSGMGDFGRMTKLSDLPSEKVLAGYIKAAMRLNEEGVKAPRAAAKKKAPVVPKELLAALKKNKKALATFDAFSTSNQREYADWIAEAKTEATRDRRVATAIEWMAEGKARNWKYANC